MFFPNKRTAFAEAWRVLKPGGRFVFNVWDRLDRNVLNDVNLQTVWTLFPTLMKASPPIPFSYHDLGTIEFDLQHVGFTNIQIETVTGVSQAASARDVAIAMCEGGSIRGEIEALGPGCLEQTLDAVTKAVSDRFRNGPIEAPNQALVVTARRPVD